MRVYIIVASIALSVIGTATGTVVDTGADAQKYCELLVEGSFHDIDEARSAGACEGMLEATRSFHQTCHRRRGIRRKAAF
jgi:hypothetical protein